MDITRQNIFVLLFAMLVITDTGFAQGIGSSYSNKTLKVVSILTAPYLTLRSQPLEGNDRFEGYIVELLDEIARIVGIKYEIYLVPDGRYGAPKEDGSWNGIVGEVIKGNADIGATGLTISFMREKVVDFTLPFINGGITTLSKKTVTRQNTNFFFFLQPFKASVWILIIISYLLVGISVGCYEKWFSPVGAEQNKEHSEQPSKLQNATIFMQGFWWTFRTFTWQGAAGGPKTYPGRILSVFWLFLVTCILCMYIASLVNLLPHVKNHQETPIQSIIDLAEQTHIKYGTLDGGSTKTFFRTSKIAIYERMWNVMASSKPSVFVESIDEGVRRVLDGNYVFLGESTLFAYQASYHCDLQSGKTWLDSKGYGLITPQGSPLKQHLNLAILSLRETGDLNRLYNKWVLRNTGYKTCEKSDSGDERQHEIKRDSVGITDVAGLFIICLFGCILSLVAAIILLIQRKCCPPQKRSSEESGPMTEKPREASPI